MKMLLMRESSSERVTPFPLSDGLNTLERPGPSKALCRAHRDPSSRALFSRQFQTSSAGGRVFRPISVGLLERVFRSPFRFSQMCSPLACLTPIAIYHKIIINALKSQKGRGNFLRKPACSLDRQRFLMVKNDPRKLTPVTKMTLVRTGSRNSSASSSPEGSKRDRPRSSCFPGDLSREAALQALWRTGRITVPKSRSGKECRC